MRFESEYNTAHRVHDGEVVLPPSERGLPYKFYEFYVPSEFVTDLMGDPIHAVIVRLEISENHPLFSRLSQKFKMKEIGTSYRVLSRRTLLANTLDPHYHKPRPETDVLRRGLVLSKYIQKVLAASPQKNIAILDDYIGYILKIEDMTYSYCPAFLLAVLLTREFKSDQEFAWLLSLTKRQKELMYGSKQQWSVESKTLHARAEV